MFPAVLSLFGLVLSPPVPLVLLPPVLVPPAPVVLSPPVLVVLSPPLLVVLLPPVPDVPSPSTPPLSLFVYSLILPHLHNLLHPRSRPQFHTRVLLHNPRFCSLAISSWSFQMKLSLYNLRTCLSFIPNTLMMVLRVNCDSPSFISVPNFSGGSLSRVTLFIRLSRFSFAFGSSMTQCTIFSTLNQTSVADSSILRYTNFPLLESSTLATINFGKSKDGLFPFPRSLMIGHRVSQCFLPPIFPFFLIFLIICTLLYYLNST